MLQRDNNSCYCGRKDVFLTFIFGPFLDDGIQSSSWKCTAVPWTTCASTLSSRQTVASFYRHQSSSGATGQAINRR